MFTLDASVVSRSLDPADPDQVICQQLLDLLEQRAIPVIVPRLFLAELAGVVRRMLRDPIRARLIIDIWTSFVHVQLISLDDRLIDTAAEFASDYALRGADAVYVAVAHHHGCILVSLDREQRERARPLVQSLTPAEVLALLAS